MEKTYDDYMGCASNPDIMAVLDTANDESVVFSAIVIKYNRWGMK
jgi:hypothetical protein